MSGSLLLQRALRWESLSPQRLQPHSRLTSCLSACSRILTFHGNGRVLAQRCTMRYRLNYLLGTELSQEELEFPSLGAMLFHSPSVDVSSTANISVPQEKQVGFKTTFPIKKLKKKKVNASFAILFRNPRTQTVRFLRGLPSMHLHFKDNLFFSVMKTSSQRRLGIIATFLEFSASLSCILPSRQE